VSRPAASRRRTENYAWLITGPLVVLTVVMFLPAAINNRQVLTSWPIMLLFLGIFVAAEAISLNIEIRGHDTTISLTEIPLVVALFYLPPLPLLTIRVLALFLVLAKRGMPPVRLAFNLASRAASNAAAILIVSTFGPLRDVSPHTWLVLFAAASTATLIGVFAVLGVITLIQGGASIRRMIRTASPGLAVTIINVTLGLLVLITVERNRWSLVLLAVLGLVLVVVYRSYGQFLRQHKSLAEIYELTRVVSNADSGNSLGDVLLGRVRGLLNAESATLWLLPQGRYPETLLSARIDDPGLIDIPATPESLRRRAVDSGETVALGTKLGGDPSLLTELRATGAREAIVVPLRSGSAVIGCLEIAGRIGQSQTPLSHADVRLLETVAAHASVAVENSRLVDRLQFDAHHDALTGLPNRRRLVKALEQAVAVLAPGEVVAVMQFDVSGLRDVNESLGHASGDELLGEVARRLRDAAPPAALVARLGSDEFVVTLRTPSSETAVNLATELRRALQDPMEIGSLTLDVDCAVGIAVHPEHGTEPATLLQRADVATHVAKSVSSAVQLFNVGLESRSTRRLGLAGDLRRALDLGELQVYFQPKVSLRTRQLVGVECLARWEHTAHGWVAPEDFIAVAEHTGQLGRLTEVVLREGLGRCRAWALAGRPLSVSVNLSPRTLTDPDFPGRVERLLEEYGVSPDRLTLEMTEGGAVGDAGRPLPSMRRLYDLGVRLAVDDFGTGYSSLSYLRRLPVHEVKIDRTFVQGMATDPGDLAIVRAVVDLSRHFGLTVVAEGVESELTLSLLEEIGCDLGQGFLFSRPLSYDRLEAWFAAQTETEPTPLGEVRRLRAVP
jgi:diguanylate cyclase (GGDEF)-like protein